MVKREKTLQRILRGTSSDASISFNEFDAISVNHRFNRSGDFSRSFATGKPVF
jgi:hypothetical protein